MRFKILTVLSCLFMLASPFVAGCTEQTSSSSITVAITQTTLEKIISAINQADSYELDSDVTNSYASIDSLNPSPVLTEWKSTRLFEIPGQGMGMHMIITSGSAILDYGEYFKDGYDYLQTVYNGVSNTGLWTKTTFNKMRWHNETQLPNLAEILGTASGSIQSGDENINGTDCYVIDVTPSAQAMLDWVSSQEQPYGPSFEAMWGGGVSVLRGDAYQSGSVKIWADHDTYLPVKVIVDNDFKGFVGGGPDTTDPPTTDLIDCSFHGELDFSGYNQPVAIELSPGALAAK